MKSLKINLKNLSIKWKIYFYLVGFCAVLLILLWLFQIVFLESFYKMIKINDVEKSASYIIENINSDNAENIIDMVSTSKDVCVDIISSDGSEIFSSDVLRECIIHKISPQDKIKLIEKIKESKGRLLEYYSMENFFESGHKKWQNGNENIPSEFKKPYLKQNQNQTLMYSKEITINNQKAYIFINSLITPVNATVNTLRIQLIIVTAVMILISLCIALIISKKVSKPIEHLNENAKHLGKDYNIEFDAKGYKEINELSKTLNFASNELSKTDSLRKELIANISHDLRTPLTLIGGYAEVMRDLPSENNSENAQIIIDETARLTALVNDVLDFSKYENGVQKLDISDFNLTKELNDIVNRVGELVKSKGYKIDFNYDKEINVKADKNRISQAVYNLLINAINYTGENKKVIITQSDENSKVKISVKDFGEGISKENIDVIWDRYYKVDKTHKRAVTGTGLGLSIVKSIVEMHGGEYGVISKENEGSIFWFDFIKDSKM